MANPSILLQRIAPDTAGAVSQGFQIGQQIRQAPLLNRLNELKLAQAEQGVDKGVSDEKTRGAMIAAKIVGDQELTPELFTRTLDVLKSQNIAVDQSDYDLSNMPLLKDKVTLGKSLISQGGESVRGFEGENFVDEAGNIFSQQTFVDEGKIQSTPMLTDITGQGLQPEGKLTPISVSEAAGAEQVKTQEMINRENVLKEKQLKIQQGQVDLAKKEMDFNKAKIAEEAKEIAAEDSFQTVQSLLGADLGLIYGRGESKYPELLRSQDGIDLLSVRDRFISLAELAEAGKMKGQGQMSDKERDILKKGATRLSNLNISPSSAKSELKRMLPIMAKAAGVPVVDSQEAFDAIPIGGTFVENGEVFVKDE